MLLLTLLGCGEIAPPPQNLPSWLSVVVRFEDQRYGSAWIDFREPRTPPEIRYSEDLVAFDGDSLTRLTFPSRLQQDADGEAWPCFDMSLEDSLLGRRETAETCWSTPPVLLRWGGESVMVEVDELQKTLSLETLELSDGEVEIDQAHFGPGQGFEIALEQGQLHLMQPLAEEGILIFQGVESLVFASWLQPDELSAGALERAQSTYKAVYRIHPVAERARVDGDLSEWQGQRALAIDRESSILLGEEIWSGPRDSSMGIAARVDGELNLLRLAVRVRDDQLLTGRDRLQIHLGERSWEIPHGSSGPEDLSFAISQTDFGFGLELELDLPARPERGDPLPLRVSYWDEDPDELPVHLASAPSARALGLTP